MGVHDWVNGLVSCKVTAKKTRSFLPGLAYPALFLSKWTPGLGPGLAVKYEQIPAGQVLSSSVEFMVSLMLQPRVKLGMQAIFSF